MKRWLFVGLFLVAVAAAVVTYFSMSRGLAVQAAQVTRGPIREFVDERGKTRLPEEHLITMPFAGRVEAIGLIEGQAVTAGEVVARISATDIEEEVAEALAAVDRLEASLVENADATIEQSTREQAELFAESMVSTVAAAEARQIAGKSRLDYAETFLGRTRKLAQTGAETQDDLDRAELAYVESQIDYRTDVLTVEALKAIQTATNLLPRIVTEQIDKKSLSAAVIRQQKQEAEARLRQALTRQQRGVMKSPVDGVVLERAITNEQYLAAGTTLLRIGQLDQLEIEADVLSEDVVRIRPGDPVEIYGPAVGATAGHGVEGVVGRIHPSGFMKISSLGVEQQRVTIIVRFAEGVLSRLRTEREIGVDYRVRVRVFTEERADTLLVPRSAIFRSADNGWETFVIRDGRAEKQAVEVGLMNDESVEVVSGLAEGDTVIVAPESNLEPGTRVDYPAGRNTPGST
ncbi:MAG: efflux RND transporter periplasmic adaptor subunit [Pirellulaceae bacterium]